jgi:polyisoprenoid-binding protein YceI
MTESQSDVVMPAPGNYQIDPAGSRIGFRTRRLFGLGPVNATFTLISGNIQVAQPVSASQVNVVLDAASFSTGNRTRDRHGRAPEFLDVENHPQIAFTSTAVTETERGWVVRGELTARGVPAPIELTVHRLAVEHGAIVVRVSGVIDRFAHTIVKMRGLAGRYLTLEITARAVPQ